MGLLNYSTTIDAVKTVGEIHARLARAKARSISTIYDGAGTPSGLSFTIETDIGLQQFSLPVKWQAVALILNAQWQQRKISGSYNNDEQARRVAWRIVKDWLDAQLALIETRMVTLDEVMLPYLLLESKNGNQRTAYELSRERFMLLKSGEAL